MKKNHKCKYYYTKKENGLIQPWTTSGWVWCNPPYGKEISKWIDKAIFECETNSAKIIMLVPARTDTKWFHKLMRKATKIDFIIGRLKFGDAKNSAPFPSAIIYLEQKDNNHYALIGEL